MGYWTLTYNGTEKSFADWGIGQGKRRRRNMMLTEFTFVASGQPIDAPDLFAYQSQVTIMRDRVGSGTASRGGTQWFQGYVTDCHRVGSAESENVQYTVGNVWWLLMSIFYKQNWPSFQNIGFTDHVILNRVPGYVLEWISVRGQLQAILDYALTKVPGAFSYDVSRIPNLFPPCDEKRNLTCDEAIKNQMQWIQDGVVKVDETQTPPKILFYSRYGDTAFSTSPISQLPVVTLPIGTGTTGERVMVASESIRALKKLQVPQVIFTYEQSQSINGKSQLSLIVDTYPPLPDGGNQLNILCQTINLVGLQMSDQTAYMESRDLSAFGPADWTDWFTQAHPFLAKVTQLTLIGSNGGQVFFTDDQNNALDAGAVLAATSFEMLNHGTFHSWMRVGNKPAGALGKKQRVKITGYFSYTDEFGNVVDATDGRELTVSVDLVNLAPGEYSKVSVGQIPDPTPGLISSGVISGTNPVWNYDAAQADTFGLSLAYWFYKTMRVLQWEGDVVVDDNQSDGEVTREDYMGVLLNLSNGLAGWATMDALVQTVDEDLESGRVTVSFGQNKLLSAGKLLDLARMGLTRAYTTYQQSMANGGSASDAVDSPDGTAKKDSTRGNAHINKDVVAFTDPGGNTMQFIRDAINQAFSAQSTDPTKGSFSLSLADLVTATTP